MTITVRPAVLEDINFMREWFKDEEILRFFPMENEKEVEDSLRNSTPYIKMKMGLTAEIDGKPVGITHLYIHPFDKLIHQSLFTIIVSKGNRGKGVGTALLNELMKLAKETFHVEILHLETYENNPAISLYNRLGFKQYGIHKKFLKDKNGYHAKVLMQKEL